MKRREILAAVVALLWCLALGPRPASAASEDPALQRRVDQLVVQLGDGSFSRRQDASKELIKVGVPAIPALRVALKSSDAEVRKRAARVLENVHEVDFQARLEAFAVDVDGHHNVQLPAWNLFRSRIGDDVVARGIFVEMQRAEPKLLASLDSGDLAACGELLAARTQTALQAVQSPAMQARRIQLSMGAVAAMLLVAATDDVSVEDQIGSQVNNFVYQSSFLVATRNTKQAPVLKKMLSEWILKDHSAQMGYYNVMLALNFELPAGLEVALRLLKQDGLPIHTRQFAIVGVGRFGAAEHMKLLEPLLKDHTNCSVQQINDRQVTTQIRDVALAMLLHLSKQDLKAYGFDKAQPHPQWAYNPNTLGFSDIKARETALKKWDEWKASQATSSN